MTDLRSAVEGQADACADLGSPMYASLLRRIGTALGTTPPLDRVLAGHEADPGPSALALRLLGTVHRLVLERRAGDLALYYPSVGGSWDLDAAWPALLHLLDTHADTVRAGLERPPQTNEVGRSAALVGALLRLEASTLPVRLVELGASAGLNLRADHYRCTGVGGAWGPADSPVQLVGAWQGRPTPVERPLRIADRFGCDPLPVDPTTTEGRILLTAYVWPDQQARLDRLRGALDVARTVPAEVRAERAEDLVGGLELVPGTCTVLWHSVMWQYLATAEQVAVTRQVEHLAAAADADAPFVHLSLEPVRRTPQAAHEFLVRAEQWPPAPGGPSGVLGASVGHGVPVTWER